MAQRGRPARLSRERIVTAAQEVVRSDGSAALSMRRVARELGCSPMALYRHVADKDELLRLLLDHITADLRRPVPTGDPRHRILQVARVVHDWLVEHAWAIDVLPAHVMGWSAAWIVEDLLAALRAGGLDRHAAADAYQVLWHQLVGELTVAHSRQASTAPPAVAPPDADRAARFPTLVAAAGATAAARRADQLEHGLQALLDGLLRQHR